MKFVVSSLLGLVITSGAIAAPDLSINGTISTTLPHKKTNNTFKQTKNKTISLLKIKASDKAILAFQKHVAEALNDKKAAKPLASQSYSPLPSSVQLGMRNVPVLDQGPHGTCVTFAVTGALDALLNQGDYISQLCSLTLGQYIENNSYMESGWNGTYAKNILSRIEQFGVVSKEKQLSSGCGNLTDYPADDWQSPSNEMAVPDYHLLSEPMYFDSEFGWTTILDMQQFVAQEVSMKQVVSNVKTALNQRDRVIISVILPIDEQIGAWGTHHVKNDSWILTPHLEQAAKMMNLYYSSDWGGHAMIITGYDDNAIATDADGQTHKGLFTLRNSWGDDAGDHGTYYMSYDYVKALGMDLIRIRDNRP